MARVYKGTAPDGTDVAVKVLAPRIAADDTAVQRFEREIEVLAGVRHPNLVELLDHGVDPVLGPFMVTRFLHGSTLTEVARRLGPLSPEAAVTLVRPLLEALSALHRAGLIHRDVKPDNAVVTDDGRLVLVDLGLALRSDHPRFTASGAVAGTVPYMAPEQLKAVKDLTPATDVWQVGTLLYELVVGRRPFHRARQTDELAAMLSGPAIPLAAVDRRCCPRLSAIVSSCLHAEPSARPADAAELLRLLEGCVDWTQTGQLGDELTFLLAYPMAFRERIGALRTARLRAEAGQCLSTGEPFRAIRLLDRALAYRPGEPRTLELVDRVTALAADVPAPGAPSGPPTISTRLHR